MLYVFLFQIGNDVGYDKLEVEEIKRSHFQHNWFKLKSIDI